MRNDDDGDDDEEEEEKEEKHNDDEERLAAFHLYLFFFSRFLPFFEPLLLLSVLSLAIHLFLSYSDERNIISRNMYSFLTNGGRLSLFPNV